MATNRRLLRFWSSRFFGELDTYWKHYPTLEGTESTPPSLNVLRRPSSEMQRPASAQQVRWTRTRNKNIDNTKCAPDNSEPRRRNGGGASMGAPYIRIHIWDGLDTGLRTRKHLKTKSRLTSHKLHGHSCAAALCDGPWETNWNEKVQSAIEESWSSQTTYENGQLVKTNCSTPDMPGKGNLAKRIDEIWRQLYWISRWRNDKDSIMKNTTALRGHSASTSWTDRYITQRADHVVQAEIEHEKKHWRPAMEYVTIFWRHFVVPKPSKPFGIPCIGTYGQRR